MLEDGQVFVTNKQIRDDLQDSITGYAYYKNDDCCGYLTVKLDGTPEAPYWILELGPIVNDYYEYSIVSDNLALSLYVLARRSGYGHIYRIFELEWKNVIIQYYFVLLLL